MKKSQVNQHATDRRTKPLTNAEHAQFGKALKACLVRVKGMEVKEEAIALKHIARGKDFIDKLQDLDFSIATPAELIEIGVLLRDWLVDEVRENNNLSDLLVSQVKQLTDMLRQAIGLNDAHRMLVCKIEALEDTNRILMAMVRKD